MKTYAYFIIAALLLSVQWACTNDDDFNNTLASPFSKVEGINGSWQVVKVEHILQASEFIRLNYDISDVALGDTPYRITFNSSDFTYSVDAGDSRNYLGQSGSWSFDDNELPTKITFQPSSGGDAIEASLNQVTRVVDASFSMEFDAPNSCDPMLSSAQGFGLQFERVNL